MISNDLKETILCNAAADRDLDRSAIDPQRWEFWCVGTYTPPTHIGEVEFTYDGYHRAIYGFDQFGTVDCYMD
jgi:hypothetical protein